jgi:hypothetical protein
VAPTYRITPNRSSFVEYFWGKKTGARQSSAQ